MQRLSCSCLLSRTSIGLQSACLRRFASQSFRTRPAATPLPAMDPNQFRKSAHSAIEDIISYFDDLPSLPVTARISPGYLRPQLPASPPQDPEPWEQISADVKSKILPGLTHWQHPNFMAFFPSIVTYPSILGEMYSAAFNAPAFNWLCSPACTELETVVMDWVAQMIGLPETFSSKGGSGGGGVIQGSASEALLTCMIAARDKYLRKILATEGLEERKDEGEEQRIRREDRTAELKGRMVAVGSQQTHSSGQKAANILGLRYRDVRAGRDARYAMTGSSLRTRLEDCRARGLIPFFVISTIGTTSTCSVDELGEIADIRRDWPDVWFHVDAAYAGAALVCEEYREVAKSKWVGDFDSFNFNMHKWLLVNFDASCLFIRNRLDLTLALSITPSYLVNPAAISGLVTDYRDWQIPLGRRFRALKIWFVIRSYGVAGMQAFIRKSVALGELFAGLVHQRPDLFEVVHGPQFALTVLRCKLPGEETHTQPRENGTAISNGTSPFPVDQQRQPRHETELNSFESKQLKAPDFAAANALTKKVYETINERGEIFLTSSILDGLYVIRVVSANERAEEKYVRRAFEILVDVTEEMRAEGANGAGAGTGAGKSVNGSS